MTSWPDELLAEVAGRLVDDLDSMNIKPPPAGPAAKPTNAVGILRMAEAAGHDVTPGHDDLHHWWTRGEGLGLWAESPHPFTTLVAQLVEHAHITEERAKTWAGAWYKEVFGYSPGSDLARVAHGKPPRGKRIGPG